MSAPIHHYLLFCSTGLGDSLFCTPALRHLRAQEPDARITVVTKDKIRNLFETNTRLDRLLSYRNNFFSMWLARRKVRAEKYRAVFLFHVGREVLSLLEGATYDELHCVQQLPGLPAAARVFPIDIQRKRQWEDFADMVALVCGGRPTNDEFEIPLDESSRDSAARFYSNIPGKKLRVGLQLGGSHLGKCWPPDRYAEVANHLVEKHSADIFINATPREESLWRTFRNHLSANAIGRTHRLPQTSIVGLAAHLRELHLFITNDTGPLHVALSQQVPVVALKAHDENTFPYTIPRATPLRRPIFMKSEVPTSGGEYQVSHRAMECIPVSAVLAETETIVANLPPRS